jgi:Family of unknown function (DUF6541)
VPDYLRAAGGLALVLFVPGLLLVVAARVRLTVFEVVGVAAAASFGVVFVTAAWATWLGVPVGPPLFVALVGALAVLAGVRCRRGIVRPVADRGDPDRTGTRNRGTSLLLATALVALGVVAGAAVWVGAMDGRGTTPPNYDGSNHGFMVARIAATERVDPSSVVVADGRGTQPAADYYPLGLHAPVAIAQRVSGAPIADLLDLAAVLFAAFVFPVGLFALTRMLWPDEPLAAGFAALVGALLTLFPYRPIAWGGIPLLVGMTLVPVTIVLVSRAVGDGWSRATAGLAGLVLAGSFAVHNSQILVIVFLVGLLVATDAVRRRSSAVARDAFVRLAGIGAIGAVLLAPTLGSFFAGASERASFRDTGTTDVGTFLHRLVTLELDVPWRQGWLALLALAGITVMLWRRRPAWVIGAVAMGALTTLAAVSDGWLSDVLTFPWYREAARVAYNLAFFVPVFAGVALAAACALARRGGVGTNWGYALVTVAVAALLYPLAGKAALDHNRTIVESGFTDFEPAGPDQVAAFEFLGAHAAPGSVVLDDRNVDGALWMYAFGGARPLFGLDAASHDRVLLDREYLRRHFGAWGSDPKVDRLVRRFGVRYVYYGEGVFAGSRHELSLARLEAMPQLRELFRRGGAHLFALNESSR